MKPTRRLWISYSEKHPNEISQRIIVLPAMLTEERFSHAEHLLADISSDILLIFTVWLQPQVLRYMPHQMPFFVVVGVGELVGTCGQAYHNNTRSVGCVGVGDSAVRLTNSTANPISVFAADSPQLTLYNTSVEGIDRIIHIHTPADARYREPLANHINSSQSIAMPLVSRSASQRLNTIPLTASASSITHLIYNAMCRSSSMAVP